MQKGTICFSLIAAAMTLIIFSCNTPGTATIPPDAPDTSSTLVAQTVEAEPTRVNTPQVASTLPITSLPVSPAPASTNHPPTGTAQPTATMTSRPCNQASFVQDVSIPNGTVLSINQAFTKIWRLKNTGSCTWTSSYKLVFVNGDQMGGPTKQPLTSDTVAPGNTADISVNLVSPASAGTYRGSWKIREPTGISFGVDTGLLNAEINVERLIPTPVVNLPDLTVTEFTISPDIPIKKQPVHVQVGIFNQGNQPASQFTVLWYGLSSFSQPSCTWNVLETISPNSGRILECDFVFQSPYPFNKTSLVIVDPGNYIVESNEGNNEGAISPFGVADH